MLHVCNNEVTENLEGVLQVIAGAIVRRRGERAPPTATLPRKRGREMPTLPAKRLPTSPSGVAGGGGA